MTFWRWRRITDAAQRGGRFCVPALAIIAAAILIYAPAPAQALLNNGENAIDILGQYNSSAMADNPGDYVKSCPNDGASPYGFDWPNGGTIDSTDHWMFVADDGNSRVLVFPLTTGNLLSGKTPSYVLGQADFTDCMPNENGTTGQAGMNGPQPVAVDPANHLLYVPDQGNNRVLVYSTSSMTNGENATYEIGQPSGAAAFTSNGTGTSATTMNNPAAVALDTTHQKLYVADCNNNRVLVFNTPVTGNGATAVNELGQPSGTAFTSATANASQSGLNCPYGVAVDATNQLLYVADSNNNRIMVFSTSGLTNGENALYEIGQPSGSTAFTSSGTATTQSGFNFPVFPTLDTTNNRLFVDDFSNNRMMIFPTPITANGENATYELGQLSWTTTNNNTGYNGLNQPGGAGYDSTNNLLYVPDSANNRVLEFNVSTVTAAPSSITQSGNDACTVTTGGALYCWGYNGYGEDGLGNTTESGTPQQVGSATTWTTISQGDPYYDLAACGIAGGALYCWGNNAYGEDGLGNTTQQTTPQQVGSATNWSSVSEGGSDTCAINSSGALYCWGYNQYGEDGLGNTTEQSSPVQITSPSTTWATVSTGSTDTCAVTTAGALYCWGHNAYGEDGLGNTTQYETPQQVGNYNMVFLAATSNDGDIGSVSAANTVCQNAAAAANLGGTYYAWVSDGTNSPSSGTYAFTHSTVPYEDVKGNTIASSWTNLIAGTLSHGIEYTAAGATESGVKVWTNVSTSGGSTTTGSSTTGNCAAWTNKTSTDKGNYGLSNSTTSTWTADTNVACNTASTYLYCFQQDGGNSWSSVSQGAEDTCAITTTGKLYCWGENEYGELGVGNTTEYNTPQQVGTLTDWTAISIQNDVINGYTGDACGIAGGALYCWGLNSGGEDGLGNTTRYSTPQQVTAVSGTWTAISYGQASTCGINSGSLYCWGGNYYGYGELGLGNTTRQTTPQLVTGVVLSSGENANDLLGEYNSMTSTATVLWTSTGANNGPNALGFENDWSYENNSGIALDPVNHQLFVTDHDNCRVLVYNLNADNSISASSGGHTASYVIGAPSLQGEGYCGNGQNQLGSPAGLAVDTVNDRLFVVDSGGDGNRVMVFSTPVTSNGPNAVGLLGFATYGYTGSGTTQSQFSYSVTDVAYDSVNENLYVSDTQNNRIMIFNVPPGFTNGENASYEFGIPSGGSEFTSSTNPGGQVGLFQPAGLAYDPVNQRLFVSEGTAVAVFSTASLSDGPSAIAVIGQSSWTSSTYECSSTTFEAASGIAYDTNNNRLFVVDKACDDVLVFNAAPSVLPTFNAQAAYVLGNTGFGGATTGTTQSVMNVYGNYTQMSPVRYDPGSGRLFVGDVLNNRVLIFEATFGSPNFMQMLPE